ncbi:MAG TPA: hypothetical protein VL947_01660 [Cytophagales bacterium]|nr:hypothetical protein [Cytophagales bacterium]
MPAAKAQQYLTALDNNDELFTYFSEVIALMSDLDEAPISPSKSAVDAIVAYASKARKVIS